MSIDYDQKPEWDEREETSEDYVKPCLLMLGTLVDNTCSGAGTDPDGGVGLAPPS